MAHPSTAATMKSIIVRSAACPRCWRGSPLARMAVRCSRMPSARCSWSAPARPSTRPTRDQPPARLAGCTARRKAVGARARQEWVADSPAGSGMPGGPFVAGCPASVGHAQVGGSATCSFAGVAGLAAVTSGESPGERSFSGRRASPCARGSRPCAPRWSIERLLPSSRNDEARDSGRDDYRPCLAANPCVTAEYCIGKYRDC